MAKNTFGLHPLQAAFLEPQLTCGPTFVTPLPFSDMITSMTSFWLNTLWTGTCFSSRALQAPSQPLCRRSVGPP